MVTAFAGLLLLRAVNFVNVLLLLLQHVSWQQYNRVLGL